MAKRLLTGSLIIVAHLTLSQPNYDLLPGSWQCYKKETSEGETGENLTLDGQPYSCDVIITLRSDFTGTESSVNFEFTYEVADTLLRLGNRLYIIEELTTQNLVILEYHPDGFSFSDFRQYFNRLGNVQ